MTAHRLAAVSVYFHLRCEARGKRFEVVSVDPPGRIIHTSRQDSQLTAPGISLPTPARANEQRRAIVR